jgi:hypothetical protein
MEVLTGGLIDLELSKILSSPNNKVSDGEYKVILHTTENDYLIDNKDFLTLENKRDYNTNISDFIVINFMMYAGDFWKEIHPYRDNLELTILITHPGLDDISKTFKFVILNNINNPYTNNSSKLSKEELNKTEQVRVEGQCVIKLVEALRTMVTDGIFTSTTVKNLMINEFVSILAESKMSGSAMGFNVDIVEPNNDMLYDHIVVKTGTKLINLPTVLQNGKYGVYNGSIGTYFQFYEDEPYLFIYPLYDKSRFDEVDKKLQIFYVNNSRLDYIENTYFQDGDIIKIIATSQTKSIDSGENDLMDSGEAYISSSPELLLERNAVVKDGDIVVSREAQLSGSKYKERRDSVSKAKYLGNESNLYKHRAKILKNTLAIYQIQWNFSDIDLLYPGMPLQFIYEDEEEGIIKLNGVLQSTYSRYTTDTNTESGILNIMVEKPIVNFGV